VGRSWPARYEADTRPAGEFAVGLGHVSGAAFLSAYDQANLLARIIERVEHGEIAFARNAVGRVDAMYDELVHQDLRAGTLPCHTPVRENRYRAIAGLIVSLVASHVVTLPVTLRVTIRLPQRRGPVRPPK